MADGSHRFVLHHKLPGQFQHRLILPQFAGRLAAGQDKRIIICCVGLIHSKAGLHRMSVFSRYRSFL
jgi:hypothetical protein